MVRLMEVTKTLISGSAGAIEIAAQLPANSLCAVAVIAHPHPLFGGSMDNKVVTTVARACLDGAAATYRFNFRGVGRSEGAHNDGEGEIEDMLSVIDHARVQHPGLPVWLCGFSFGGAVALAACVRVCESVNISEMILIAPAFQRLAHWQTATSGGLVPESTLIIHGEKDETVPLADSFNWARPRNIPVIVIPDADHFFHQRLHIIRQIASRWLPTPA